MVVELDYSVFYVILCLLIIFWVAKRFLLAPLSRILDERAEMIESSQEEARIRGEEIERELAEYSKRISEARAEGFALRRGLKEDALEKERELIEIARGEAGRKLAEAQEKLKQTVEEGKQTLFVECERVADEIAAAVISVREK